jgi:hypothetical protein
MTRAFELTLSFALAVETDRGSQFTLASKLTLLPKRRRYGLPLGGLEGLWKRVKDKLAQVSQAIIDSFLPAPLFAG